MDDDRLRSSTKPILVTVDDQPDQRRLIRLMLSQYFEVVEAPHSGYVFDLVSDMHVQYVLTDSNLKNYDGFRLCKELKDAFPKIPVIFVSASGDVPHVRTRIIDAGANAIVTKPFLREHLLHAVHEVAGIPHRPFGPIPRTHRMLAGLQTSLRAPKPVELPPLPVDSDPSD